MASGAIAYEEQRRRTMEANNRKMEELRLHHLSTAVREAVASKPSPAKSVKRKLVMREDVPREAMPLRRSGRVASLPDKPKYSYEDSFEPENKIRRGRKTRSTRKDLVNRVYASQEARDYATSKAGGLEEKLGCRYPSFVKPLTQSHVTGGFWLGLPAQFCRTYLPKHNEWITLVDETGNETEALYIWLKTGLSGGWVHFSKDHGLVAGDCLVFEMIEPAKFRVYIIRHSSYR